MITRWPRPHSVALGVQRVNLGDHSNPSPRAWWGLLEAPGREQGAQPMPSAGHHGVLVLFHQDLL